MRHPLKQLGEKRGETSVTRGGRAGGGVNGGLPSQRTSMLKTLAAIIVLTFSSALSRSAPPAESGKTPAPSGARLLQSQDPRPARSLRKQGRARKARQACEASRREARDARARCCARLDPPSASENQGARPSAPRCVKRQDKRATAKSAPRAAQKNSFDEENRRKRPPREGALPFLWRAA